MDRKRIEGIILASDKGETWAKQERDLLFEHGFTYEKYDRMRIVFYKRRAEAGDVFSQYMLGSLLDETEEALFWLTKAAEGGSVAAMNSLGLHYYLRREDKKKSFDWFMRAAELGDAQAQEHVGRSYGMDNEGVEKDIEAAITWLTKSALQGYAQAQYWLGDLFNNFLDREHYDPQKAAYWYLRAAEQGDRFAQSSLGYMLAKGDGVEQDIRMAIYWFEQSAFDGNDFSRENAQELRQKYNIPLTREEHIRNHKDYMRRKSPEMYEQFIKEGAWNEKPEMRQTAGTGKKGGCYIATAVYGSYEAPQVLVLRRFRDQVLSKSFLGRIFIKTYYTCSPPIATYLSNRDHKMNCMIKKILDKIVLLLSR